MIDPTYRGAASLTVAGEFERHAAETPGRIAVTMAASFLSYGQLNDQADRVARRLRELGVRPGARVGVCLGRGVGLIVAILGVAKAGAAYVPLDPEYPTHRLDLMMADASLSALVTGAGSPATLPVGSLPVLSVPLVAAVGDPQPAENFTNAPQPDAAAYLMFTSGSTGTPKGVVVPHRGIIRLVVSPDYVEIGQDDVFLQLAPSSFDASTFEIWGALLNGARLAVMPPGPVSLAEIGDAIRREGVTILWLTGGLFNLMVDERIADLKPVKQLLVGGEALSVAHVKKALAALPNTQLINGYGPTENTTFTCCHRIRRGEDFSRGVPIGRPIRGTCVKVVDEQLQEVGTGEEGELLAGGEGVALGYWNRPELTAEKFINHLSPGGTVARYYRTGDRVRVRADGIIEFLGRRDEQVKLRGFRIELGEIEAAIRTCAGVRDCVVKVVTADRAQGYLAAYVVRTSPEIGPAELSAQLSCQLPEHMLPGAWVFLEQLPLNPNGKVDRAALLDPPTQSNGAAAEPPGSELERIISETWSAVLGGRQADVNVSFFDAGGNSLQVTRLHERLRREHGISIPLTHLFQFPSVRSLARHVADARLAGTSVAAGDNPRGTAQRQALGRFRKARTENA